MTVLDRGTATPIGADRPDAAHAGLGEIDGRTVALFHVDGRRSDSSGAAEAEVVERALVLAEQIGCPVVGVVRSVAISADAGGLDALAAWGRVAARSVRLSGVVPLLLAVTGPVHGSLAPLIGLADHVVVTRDATAYLNGPAPVRSVTGRDVDPVELGGAPVHTTRSGLASLVAEDEDDALEAIADLIAHLPDNHLTDPPRWPRSDPPERRTDRAAAAVPVEPTRAYDVREVITDVFDADSVLEVHAGHAPNIVTAYARLDGRPVAVVANQPSVRAGTIDIDASCKAARHVHGSDALGIPIITFVDTPGYEPGRDLEWRGMIRHGAKLVHAYAGATVPRLGVILRKAYGGAYIVMDSRTTGNDLMLAWPTAEIAVMGAPGAVAILNRRELDAAADPTARRTELEQDYATKFLSPRIAAERGLVDQVIDPADTRRVLAAALRRLATKRPGLPARRHANEPL
ncbi:acyl-CoA carboxylase subunit beta [Aquihabitans daechungensis]|uniref:acyl-CoA carboxylase subunit beta n=1 Tax=Aquihabitans daechungensis TaxID=1052257 RepID=UPI003BA19B19